MMNHSMSSNESMIVMALCMILAGFFSGMNAFVNDISDVRFNLNDFYMSVMMIGGMFFFMSIYYKSIKLALVGIGVILIALLLIRKQLFINTERFIQSMIPHHSMAIMMSKRFLEKKKSREIGDLAQNIISTQKDEIQFMKEFVKNIT